VGPTDVSADPYGPPGNVLEARVIAFGGRLRRRYTGAESVARQIRPVTHDLPDFASPTMSTFRPRTPSETVSPCPLMPSRKPAVPTRSGAKPWVFGGPSDEPRHGFGAFTRQNLIGLLLERGASPGHGDAEFARSRRS